MRRCFEYGIDAPLVVRNLSLFALAALSGACLSSLIPVPIWYWICFLYCISMFLSLTGSAAWTVYSSLFLKKRLINHLVNRLDLKGDEKILDIGCGRGIALFELVGRLKGWKCYGVDLWTQDQSGNTPEAVLKKAESLKVENRIGLKTGDMRHLPFPDGTFDVTVSSLAIHNIDSIKDREKALSELLRILRPGGKFMILDIKFGKEYAAYLQQKANIILSKPLYRYCPPIQWIIGEKKQKNPIGFSEKNSEKPIVN